MITKLGEYLRKVANMGQQPQKSSGGGQALNYGLIGAASGAVVGRGLRGRLLGAGVLGLAGAAVGGMLGNKNPSSSAPTTPGKWSQYK